LGLLRFRHWRALPPADLRVGLINCRWFLCTKGTILVGIFPILMGHYCIIRVYKLSQQ
jgi:hypothetical protein